MFVCSFVRYLVKHIEMHSCSRSYRVHSVFPYHCFDSTTQKSRKNKQPIPSKLFVIIITILWRAFGMWIVVCLNWNFEIIAFDQHSPLFTAPNEIEIALFKRAAEWIVVFKWITMSLHMNITRSNNWQFVESENGTKEILECCWNENSCFAVSIDLRFSSGSTQLHPRINKNYFHSVSTLECIPLDSVGDPLPALECNEETYNNDKGNENSRHSCRTRRIPFKFMYTHKRTISIRARNEESTNIRTQNALLFSLHTHVRLKTHWIVNWG